MPDQQEVADHSARDLAREAMSSIAKHEAVCAERYAGLLRQLADLAKIMAGEDGPLKTVRDDVTLIKDRLWSGAMALLSGTAVLCGFLAGKLLHWF